MRAISYDIIVSLCSREVFSLASNESVSVVFSAGPQRQGAYTFLVSHRRLRSDKRSFPLWMCLLAT